MGEPAPPPGQASVAQLVSQLTEQTSRLVRDEVELAKVELTSKAKQAGMGAGLFSAAGLLALYGFGALVATAILALALVMDAWLAALVVAVGSLRQPGWRRSSPRTGSRRPPR